MTTIKAILFDYDGTLVDSEFLHFEMWVAILESHGVILKVEDYIDHYAGIPTPENAAVIVDRYSLTISPSVLITAKSLATKSFLSRKAFPLTVGARRSIDFFIEKGIKIAIVTGASRIGVDATIATNNFQGHFQTIVTGDDVKNSKPSPEGYLLAVQQLGLNVSECIAIEDSENGVAAAVSANISCVAISTTMSKSHDLNDAIKIFSDLDEARIWIANNYRLHNNDC